MRVEKRRFGKWLVRWALGFGFLVRVSFGQEVPLLFEVEDLAPSAPALSANATKIDPVPPPAAKPTYEVFRVISPGVFDVKVGDFQVRFRAWGVGFPRRDQPGYREALRFTEEQLLNGQVRLEVKRAFDVDNLKLAEVLPAAGGLSFSRQAILSGRGWHLENETQRYGPFTLAQMKAKRMSAGVWKTPFAYEQMGGKTTMPRPLLPGKLFEQEKNPPAGAFGRISFWVSSLGKVHAPGCAFYRKGRGALTSSPQGYDCRICGGRNPKKTP